MVFDGGFRFREADAETDGKCHRGQARRARQEPDGQRFGREIRVFPAQAHMLTKNYKRHDLDACFGESVGFVERSVCGTEEITQSRPLGAIAANLDRPRKIWKTRRGFQVWRGSSGQSLNTSAIADTLLTKDFLEAGGSSDCLKKVWRKPAAVFRFAP